MVPVLKKIPHQFGKECLSWMLLFPKSQKTKDSVFEDMGSLKEAMEIKDVFIVEENMAIHSGEFEANYGSHICGKESRTLVKPA